MPPRPYYCAWCNNRGCAACFSTRKALDEEYERQFPNGPEPIFTAHRDNPQEMELLNTVFGREALERAFGESGGGMQEILGNLEREKARLLQDAPSKTIANRNGHPDGRSAPSMSAQP